MKSYAASEAAASKKIRDSLSAQKIARMNLAAAEKRVTGLKGARNAGVLSGAPSLAALKAANDAVTKSKERLAVADRNVAAASKGSAQSIAAAARATAALRAASESLAAAQEVLALREAELAAARSGAAASAAAETAAEERLAVASSTVAAAQEKLAAATEAVSVSNKSAMLSAAAFGAGLGAKVSAGAKQAERSLVQLASRTQWLGRQLQTNFTMPIAIAGGFAIKFALDNEKAMTDLKKVYGDKALLNAIGPSGIQGEIDALGRHFRALSEEYGIQQDEVIKVGAAWAAAGSSGVALAKATDLTLRTMIIGDMDATKATESLIAIQAQYGMSTTQLADTLNKMNAVENETGLTMADLVDGMARSSAAAADAGVDVNHLLASIAALSPAAGSAANAGNGLKTIFTRLIAPTHDAVELMKAAGITVSETAWKTTDASGRLKILNDRFKQLSPNQQVFLKKAAGGIYQITRLSTLLKQMDNPMSFYNKALRAQANSADVLRVAQNELQTVLDSNPNKLKRLGVILQNSAADVGTQLVPALIMAVTVLKDMAQAFNNLNPYIQKTIVTSLLFLAVVGPIVRYGSSILVLFGVLGGGLKKLAFGFILAGASVTKYLIMPFRILSAVMIAVMEGFFKVITAIRAMSLAGAGISAILRTGLMSALGLLVSWPGLLLAALVAAFAIFHKQINQAFHVIWAAIGDNLAILGKIFSPLVGFFNKVVDGITNAFYRLPQGIQSAMLAVVKIVQQAVMAVYTLFSYLNPFAHHSPSLVENVQNGMAIVRSEFASITSISNPINKAYADIERFKNATKDMVQGLDSFKRAADLKTLLSFAPGAAGAFIALVHDLQRMQPVLDKLEKQMKAQQTVVDAWQKKLDALNSKLDEEKQKLTDLQDVASGWATKLQEAQDRLSKFADAPLQGLGAMEDQIFANEQAQKALQLQMMNLEDVVGPIDKLKDRLAALAGDIEVLKGEQIDLQQAGAGSDILSVYDAQIQALENQQGAINDTASQYNDLQAQLDALDRAAQRLDLQKSLNFDGLQRDIQKAATAIQEMPFDQIMAGIQQAQADIATYGTEVDKANQKVKEQQDVVDALQKKYDALNKTYKQEQDKLDGITDRYNKMRDAVEAVKQALDDVGQAAQDAASKGMKKKKGAGGGVSPAVQDFLDAGGAGFDTTGGKNGPGREGGLGSQASMIDDLTKQLQQKQSDLAAKLDIFKPLRDKWDEFTAWWKKTVTPSIDKMMSDVSKGFGGIDWSAPFKNDKGGDTGMTKFFKGTGDAFVLMGKGMVGIWKLLGPDLQEFADVVGQKLVKAGQQWWPQIVGLGKALLNLWNAIKPLVQLIGVVLLGALKILTSVLAAVVGPVLDFIINLVSGVILILSGLINFVAYAFTADWTKAWDAIVQILQGFLYILLALWNGTGGQLIAFVKGFVEGIVHFFQWLYDVLVGHSIIPDLINAIVDWFTGLPGKILGALISLGQKLLDLIRSAWSKLQDGLNTAWTATYTFLLGLPQKMYDALTGALKLLKSAGSALFGAVWDGIKDIWSSVSTWIADKVTWVINKFGGIKDSLAGKFSGMFDGIKDAFRSAINFIISGWNGIEFKIPGFHVGPVGYDGFSLGLPDIPLLARGGTALKNRMHVVGEAGPEFFSPGTTGRVTSNNDIFTLMKRATEESLSTLAGLGAGGVARMPSVGQLGTTASQANRRIAVGTAGTAGAVAPTSVTNNTEYHFHGDLSFPNIKSGEDAETFLTNLSDLAG